MNAPHLSPGGANAQPQRPLYSNPLRTLLLACLLAFTSSFCVMVIELVAGRVIAKHVGASLYTWTSVIGIVLGGISVGNFFGGRLADWFHPKKTLSVLFVLAALTTLGVPLADSTVGSEGFFSLSEVESWPLRIALHVAFVFLPPACVLGLIGPVVAKMALDQGGKAGTTVGYVYACAALGSIVGTFLTGFYLVQAMNVVGILFSVAGLLTVVGLALAPSLIWPGVVATKLIFLVMIWQGPWEWRLGNGELAVREKPDSTSLYAAETQYSSINVSQDEDETARELHLDNLIHAYYDPDDITNLEYEYEKIYAAVTRRCVGDKKTLSTLFFGGGGYIFPRYVRHLWPGSRIEVAEIDPGVTAADIEAFGLLEEDILIAGQEPVERWQDPEAPPSATEEVRRIDIFHLDARNHVEDLVRRQRSDPGFEPFDVIYGDAFNYYAVPYHLITREFTAKVKELLRPSSGVYLINIIDIYHYSRFLGAVYLTMKEVFPHVEVFSNTAGEPGRGDDDRDTFIVVCSLGKLDLTELGQRPGESAFTGSQLTEEHYREIVEKAQGLVLTDNYAPVENLLSIVVRKK